MSLFHAFLLWLGVPWQLLRALGIDLPVPKILTGGGELSLSSTELWEETGQKRLMERHAHQLLNRKGKGYLARAKVEGSSTQEAA